MAEDRRWLRTTAHRGHPDELALAKYEGLGNDFLVLVDLEGRLQIDAPLARLACDRHLGFGADGLLRAGPPPVGSSDEDDLRTAQRRWQRGGDERQRPALPGPRRHRRRELSGPGRATASACSLRPAGREVHVHALEDGWMWASTEMGEPKVVGAADAATWATASSSSTWATRTWWCSALIPGRSTWLRSARL